MLEATAEGMNSHNNIIPNTHLYNDQCTTNTPQPPLQAPDWQLDSNLKLK